MLARRYSGHTRREQEGKDTMWVYQETKTEADALVPRLPEREPLPMKEAEQTSHTPEPPQKEIPRRKRFRASRDCILLAAAYLFGTLMAGILQALCDAEEMETLAYYLSCWRSAFAASSTPQAVGLFGTELAVVLGAAAVFLLLGLSFWTLQCRAVCITFIYLYYHTTSGPEPQENQPLIRPASDDLQGTQARWLRRRAGRGRRSARQTVLPEAVPLRYGECRPPSRLSRRKRRGCGC